jgi:hypothetical protein
LNTRVNSRTARLWPSMLIIPPGLSARGLNVNPTRAHICNILLTLVSTYEYVLSMQFDVSRAALTCRTARTVLSLSGAALLCDGFLIRSDSRCDKSDVVVERPAGDPLIEIGQRGLGQSPRVVPIR